MFNMNVKVNAKQKSILFDAMLRYRHVLDGRTFALRTTKNDLWEKLTAQLNKIGPQKDVTQWKKCWTDLRLAIKKKKRKQISRRSLMVDRSVNYYESKIACELAEQAQAESVSIDDDLPISVKDEEPDDERELNSFEEVIVPTEPATDQDLMRGTIKIEDSALFPINFASDNDYVFRSTESLNHDPSSRIDQQASDSETIVTGGRNMQEAYLLDILKESKKQTALLQELLSRLAQ